MTDKKEQARKLREAAEICKMFGDAACVTGLVSRADRLDPQPKEQWEELRDTADLLGACSSETYWKTVLIEANRRMVTELKKRAPWFSGGSGPEFSPSSYDQGISAFLRVLESL